MDEKINQPENKNKDIPNLKTYTSDMAEVIREKEMSVIKIAMAEKEKREREELIRSTEVSGWSKFFLAMGGIILVAGSIIGIYYLTLKKNEVPVPVNNTTDRQTIIPYDEKISIDTTKINYTEVNDLIKLEKEKFGNPKSVRAIFVVTNINGTEEILPLDNIFSITNISIPAPIKRSLNGEYMLGVYTPKIIALPENLSEEVVDYKITPNLFLIVKTTDYNISYAGMLAWEKTMIADLSNSFSTNQAVSLTEENSFEDTIINNKDVRVLKNSGGRGILYYFFTDKNTLVITSGGEAASEIINRLINKK